jgi:hypothetical protein
MTTAGAGTQAPLHPTFGKVVRELLPLAIALVVFAAAEWFLLTQGWALGTWLLAGFLAVHGLIHFSFLAPKPPQNPSGLTFPPEPARSWPVTRLGLSTGALRAVGALLALIAAVGYVLAGLATIGFVVPTVWWASLVVGSSVISLVLFVLYLSPSLLLGIAIDLVLLWLAWSAAWTPAV